VAEACSRVVVLGCHRHEALLAGLASWLHAMQGLDLSASVLPCLLSRPPISLQSDLLNPSVLDEHPGLVVVDSLTQLYAHRLGKGHYQGSVPLTSTSMV
jgi:hypothetical protein